MKRRGNLGGRRTVALVGRLRQCSTHQINSPLRRPRHGQGYHGVLFHELTHATGHPSRLNRRDLDTPAWFGSETYSREELAAPEDYTVLERSRIESVVYRNCRGQRTLVARIVMLPPTACATCDQPLDHHPLCLLHRRPAAWCDCGAATAHMVESERHRWTARSGERCPRGHHAVEALALANGLERRRCRSCDYRIDAPASHYSCECCDNSGNAGWSGPSPCPARQRRRNASEEMRSQLEGP